MQGTMTWLDTGGRGANPLSRLFFMALLAVLLLPASAAAQPTRVAPLRNPALSSLQIEIWPEYDRPAALVIFRGALAEDVPLPANVALRIPAASGGPSAIAYSAADGGSLLNLDHERVDSGAFITLRFKLSQRFFHVEFYDPVATGAPERSYTYVWPGDMEVKRLGVVVQEPAASSSLSVQPNLSAGSTGKDGLRFRAAELGAQAAGKQLPIQVRYSKTDPRTSVEILQPKASAPAPAPAADSGSEVTKGVLIFILALSLLIGIGTGVLWWRGRATAPAAPTRSAGVCAKCGTPRIAGTKYCANCGARHK